MIKKLVFAIFILATLLIEKESLAQDPIFSQFYANPLYLNPALAGSAVCPRLTLNYRNQWPSISGTFVTYNASYDQYIDGISGGIGVIATGDRAGEGALSTMMISGIYSYRLKINRNLFLNAAFQATFLQRRIDWNSLTFGDQIDPKYGFVNITQERPPDNQSREIADFSSGIMFSHKENFYGGVAVHHMTQPNDGFYSDISSKLYLKLTVHFGTIIDLRKRRSGARQIDDPTISPNILYQQQQNFQQLNYGIYVNKYPFVGGVWFRQNFENSDAFILLAGFQQPSFKFAYSYDLTVSKLTNITGGAHEFSFTWQFKCPTKKAKVKTINCPSF